MSGRLELVEKKHPRLSVRAQCELLGVARSTLDYEPAPERVEDERLKRLLDEIYLRDPCLGTRRLVTILERDYQEKVNRKRLQRLRREMGARGRRAAEGYAWPLIADRVMSVYESALRARTRTEVTPVVQQPASSLR